MNATPRVEQHRNSMNERFEGELRQTLARVGRRTLSGAIEEVRQAIQDAPDEETEDRLDHLEQALRKLSDFMTRKHWQSMLESIVKRKQFDAEQAYVASQQLFGVDDQGKPRKDLEHLEINNAVTSLFLLLREYARPPEASEIPLQEVPKRTERVREKIEETTKKNNPLNLPYERAQQITEREKVLMDDALSHNLVIVTTVPVGDSGLYDYQTVPYKTMAVNNERQDFMSAFGLENEQLPRAFQNQYESAVDKFLKAKNISAAATILPHSKRETKRKLLVLKRKTKRTPKMKEVVPRTKYDDEQLYEFRFTTMTSSAWDRGKYFICVIGVPKSQARQLLRASEENPAFASMLAAYAVSNTKKWESRNNRRPPDVAIGGKNIYIKPEEATPGFHEEFVYRIPDEK